MYESKRTPGKKFGSIFAGRKYDEAHTEDGMHSESPEHEAKETPEFEAGEREGMDKNFEDKESEMHDEMHGGEEHPAVKEHGKAHKVVIHHDEASGRHTVQSHHADGHVHTNVHEHAHKAHDEARELSAVPPAGKEGNEEKDSPFHKGKAQQGASSEEDGFMAPDIYAQE
jgi:hypothetical protein